MNESYLYDETGQRLRKTNNLTGVSTFYPFAGYEQTGGGAVTKHYSFGGRFVAVRSPSGSLSFLFQDQVSSTVYVTNADGSKQAARGYYDFGVTRYTEGVMPSEYHFTSQREDGTGLYYYGARYYDPDLGNFISPDTIVPDPTRLIDYNRYLYARGNPVKYNDPTGHFTDEEILESLRLQYGEEQASIIFGLWQENDIAWIDALHNADIGAIIWASDLEGTGTFGAEGGRISLVWSNFKPKSLAELQGKGGYQVIRAEDGVVFEPPAICQISCKQAVYEYDEHGLKGDGSPSYERSIEYWRGIKMPWTEWKLGLLTPGYDISIVRAPYEPTGSNLGSFFENVAGFAEPLYDVYQLASSLTGAVSELHVVVADPQSYTSR